MAFLKQRCPALGPSIILRSQTFHGIAGIADDVDAAQTDYECLEEDTCEHHASLGCRVRHLNLGDGNASK